MEDGGWVARSLRSKVFLGHTQGITLGATSAKPQDVFCLCIVFHSCYVI